MRLLIILHSLGGGGAERVTTTLANEWVANGWQISLVTIASADDDRYSLHPAIHRISLDQAQPSTGPVTAAFRNLRRLLSLRRVLRNERPDAALSMMPVANTLLALASIGLKCVSIGSERSYPPALPLPRAWRILRKWSYARLGAVVAPTEEIRGWLLKHTLARRVVVIPNPVAWPFAATAPQVQPSKVGRSERRRLLAVGRLGNEKRFVNLIEAFASLVPRFPDWELVLVGEGPERARLSEMIESAGLSATVFLAGHVGNLGDWYRSADLFTLTSRFEGFPNVLVEALAHGLPAVSVDCNTGPRDIIRPGVDGLLIPPEDDSALADALGHLMGDAGLRERFGARAIEARERFSLARTAAAWERLLRGGDG